MEYEPICVIFQGFDALSLYLEARTRIWIGIHIKDLKWQAGSGSASTWCASATLGGSEIFYKFRYLTQVTNKYTNVTFSGIQFFPNEYLKKVRQLKIMKLNSFLKTFPSSLNNLQSDSYRHRSRPWVHHNSWKFRNRHFETKGMRSISITGSMTLTTDPQPDSNQIKKHWIRKNCYVTHSFLSLKTHLSSETDISS